MRHLVSILLCLSVFLAPCAVQARTNHFTPKRIAQSETLLAVLNLDAKGDATADQSSIVTDRIRAQLLHSGRYRIMERSRMELILREQGFQESMSDCHSVDCSIQLGRLLSVPQLLTGSLSRVGGLYTLSVRLIDTQSGQILQERYLDCSCPLEEVLTNVSAQLVKQLTNASNSPTTTTAEQIKDPTAVFWLNLPGPFGYWYMEEWGWFSGLLAVDLIAITALVFNNWAWPGANLTAWLALAGTRIFGILHGPGLANAHNNEIKRQQLGMDPAGSVPLFQASWSF